MNTLVLKRLAKSRSLALLCVLVLVASTAAEERTWTSADGRTMQAEFVRSSGDDVTFIFQGKEITLPITRFSEEDQQVIRDLASGTTTPAGDSSDDDEASSTKKPKSTTATSREWTDTLGNKLTAKFLRVVGPEVVLQRASRVTKIPFINLSPDDRAYVRQMLADRGDEAALAALPAENSIGGAGGIDPGMNPGVNPGAIPGAPSFPGIPSVPGPGAMPGPGGIPGPGVGPGFTPPPLPLTPNFDPAPIAPMPNPDGSIPGVVPPTTPSFTPPPFEMPTRPEESSSIPSGNPGFSPPPYTPPAPYTPPSGLSSGSPPSMPPSNFSPPSMPTPVMPAPYGSPMSPGMNESTDDLEVKAMQERYKDYPIVFVVMRHGREQGVCTKCLTPAEVDLNKNQTKGSKCKSCGAEWWDAHTADFWIDSGIPSWVVYAGMFAGIGIVAVIGIGMRLANWSREPETRTY